MEEFPVTPTSSRARSRHHFKIRQSMAHSVLRRFATRRKSADRDSGWFNAVRIESEYRALDELEVSGKYGPYMVTYQIILPRYTFLVLGHLRSNERPTLRLCRSGAARGNNDPTSATKAGQGCLSLFFLFLLLGRLPLRTDVVYGPCRCP